MRSRSPMLYVSLGLLGALCFAAATVWSAIDYNATEELLGEGETGPMHPGILVLAALGGAIIIIGLGGLLIEVLERRAASSASFRR